MARVRFVLIVILLGGIVIFAGGVTPAHAINCGDTLGPGGSFELQQDLDCSREGGLTVNGARLDLNGHIVTCPDGEIFGCIQLTGGGAQLLNGAVRGGFHVNIRVGGTGGHLVRNITSTRVDGNINVTSDNNRLINVMAESVFSQAFIISGNNNELIDSIATCFSVAFTGCIDVSGGENRLVDNFVTSPDGDRPGLQISGNKNVVRRNRVIRNLSNGGPGSAWWDRGYRDWKRPQAQHGA